MKKVVYRGAVLASLAVLFGCGDEDIQGPGDRVAPTIEILEPTEGEIVDSTRPTFRIRVTDNASGILCSTLQATLEGVDVSNFFLNGCDEVSGEIFVRGPVLAPEGDVTLQLRIADNAGNVATQTREFLVNDPPPPAPGPPANLLRPPL